MTARRLRASAALLWTLLAAAPAVAQRAPYLQQGTPTSMVVAWRTTAPTPSVVCWGPSVSSLTHTASTPGTATQHEVRIGGLSPATRYYYAAGASSCPPAGGGDASDFFVTSPEAGTRAAFRMWVVGDSGTGGSRQQQVTDAMLGWVGDRRPDLYLHMGDMAYTDGTTDQFTTRFFAMYEPLLRNTVCWPTMGNHEGHTSVSATETGPYYEAYVLPRAGEAGGMPSGTEAYYSFDYANVHFVVLESHQSSRAPEGAMLTWLAEDLAATDQEWIVAFWHHPPYTKGSHNSDTEGALIAMRQNALPILEAWGVDLVLGGHSHIYERSWLLHGAYATPSVLDGSVVDMGDGRLDGDGAYQGMGDGAVYVVSGHGGTGVSGPANHPLMYFSEVQNGSNIVDVSGGTLSMHNIRYDGVETDWFTIVKEEGIFLTSPTGGERYLAGSTIDVTWVSIGDTTRVRIDYSLDGGEHWAVAVAETPEDGHHAWTSPENLTTAARIRVTDVDDPTRTSESGDFELAATAFVDVIGFGGLWEYHDDGVDQGTAWLGEVGGWSSGPAQLGYGDGDEATVLRRESPNIPSVYFRQPIRLEGEVSEARLRVLYDDAIAVWINGTEVFRRNMADGTDFATFASASSADNEVEEATLDLSGGNPFVIGDNVIAAMVKQSSATSSDLSFDLALSLEVSAGDLDPEPWPPRAPGSDGGTTVLPDGAVVGPDGAVIGGGGAGSATGGCACDAAGEPWAAGWPAAMALLSVWVLTVRRRHRRRGRGLREANHIAAARPPGQNTRISPSSW